MLLWISERELGGGHGKPQKGGGDRMGRLQAAAAGVQRGKQPSPPAVSAEHSGKGSHKAGEEWELGGNSAEARIHLPMEISL